MIVVRNVFLCKPGEAKTLAAKFKSAGKAMKSAKAIKNSRVLTDASASFWTVVFETEHESMAAYEQSFGLHGTDAKIRKAMEGYMDLVNGGHREIWKVE